MTEPVTAAELATMLRIDVAADDTDLLALIAMARDYAERITGRAIIRQQLVATFDRLPTEPEQWYGGVREGVERPRALSYLNLPRAAPLVSVDSFVTYDDADVATTATIAALFIVDRSSESKVGRLVLKTGQVWPTALRFANAIEVTYTAGWTPATTPPLLKRAIAMLAAHMYSNRGDCAEDCADACGAIGAFHPFIIARL